MPDEHGNFKPGFAIRGRGGTLMHGFRVISDLGRWDAEVKGTTEDSKQMTLRLNVRDHDEDPFEMEHAPESAIVLEMNFGRREWRGPAKILSRQPKLVIEATVEEQ